MDDWKKREKRRRDYHVIKMDSLSDVWQAVKDKEDYKESLFNLYYCQLMAFEDVTDDLNYVEILYGRRNPPCSECEKLIGKVFKLQDEIREQHLPNKKCKNEVGKVESHEFCLFYYEAVFDNEL